MALRTSEEEKGNENPLISDGSSNTGQGASDGSSKKSGSEASGAAELDNAERNPKNGKQGAVGGLEEKLVKGGLSALGGPVGSGANMISSLFSRKKKTITGVVLGMVIGISGIFGFGIIQGPLQLIHLGQILQNPFSDQEQASENRLNRLLRFARSGDIGDTRVSFLGSRSANKTLARLDKEAGIKILDKTGAGRPSVVEIDTAKYKPGLTTAEAAASYADAHNIPFDQVRMDFDVADQKGGKFTVGESGTALPDSTSRSIFKEGIGKLYGKLAGPIMVAVKSRTVFAKNGTFSKLRIWKRLNTYAMEKAVEADEKRQARKTEKTPRAESRLNKLKGKIKPAAGIAAAAGAVQLGGCIALDVAHEAPLATYENVVMPSENQALEYIVGDSQLRSGDNFVVTQPGAMVRNLTDENGNTVWQSKAMNAMTYRDGGSGEDAPEGFKNSFRSESPVLAIEKELNKYGGKFICSTVGEIIGGVIGIGALVLAAPTAGISLGVYAGAAVGSTLAVAGGAYFLTKAVSSILAEEAIYNDPQGRDLGHTIAFGSQALAADMYRKSGGAPIEGQSTTSKPLLTQNDEFQQKSFFARTFDIYDYRSLTSRVIDNSSFDTTQTLASLANSFSTLSSLFSNVFNIFSPQLFAADDGGAYDFGFPRYGFTQADLDNPLTEDPYENAKKAIDILESDDDYVDRAKDCFGVEFDESNGWKVDLVDNPDGDPEKDVLPNTAKYHEADCGDRSNKWLIVRLFIFDSRIMESYACYEGVEEDACIQPEGGVPSGASGAASDIGDANLSKTITVNTKGKFITMPGKYSCPGRTTRIDSRIAASLAYLLDKYNMCADDGLASGHLSHGAGLGVDIRPKDQSKQMSKQEWMNTVEKAARDMGWTGDSANEGKSNKGCAPNYSGYGQCVGGNGQIPNWVRWLGYNGDVDHGDPWHIFGGTYAHIHIGWASPNGGDDVASSEIAEPIPAVLTFPAPIPDDLEGLL